MSDRINCRNCIHFNDLEHRCCLNDGYEIEKECYFTLSKRKPKGKDIVIENLKTKITDLEAKLAESENTTCKHIAELTRIATEKDRKIEQLKQQFAEKEADLIALDTDNYSFKQQIDNLRQQLTEKEKLLEMNERILRGTKLVRQELEQEKISFAVEKLEEVKYYAQHIQGGLINYIENQIKAIKGEK